MASKPLDGEVSPRDRVCMKEKGEVFLGFWGVFAIAVHYHCFSHGIFMICGKTIDFSLYNHLKNSPVFISKEFKPMERLPNGTMHSHIPFPYISTLAGC